MLLPSRPGHVLSLGLKIGGKENPSTLEHKDSSGHCWETELLVAGHSCAQSRHLPSACGMSWKPQKKWEHKMERAGQAGRPRHPSVPTGSPRGPTWFFTCKEKCRPWLPFDVCQQRDQHPCTQQGDASMGAAAWTKGICTPKGGFAATAAAVTHTEGVAAGGLGCPGDTSGCILAQSGQLGGA